MKPKPTRLKVEERLDSSARQLTAADQRCAHFEDALVEIAAKLENKLIVKENAVEELMLRLKKAEETIQKNEEQMADAEMEIRAASNRAKLLETERDEAKERAVEAQRTVDEMQEQGAGGLASASIAPDNSCGA